MARTMSPDALKLYKALIEYAMFHATPDTTDDGKVDVGPLASGVSHAMRVLGLAASLTIDQGTYEAVLSAAMTLDYISPSFADVTAEIDLDTELSELL